MITKKLTVGYIIVFLNCLLPEINGGCCKSCKKPEINNNHESTKSQKEKPKKIKKTMMRI